MRVLVGRREGLRLHCGDCRAAWVPHSMPEDVQAKPDRSTKTGLVSPCFVSVMSSFIKCTEGRKGQRCPSGPKGGSL